MIKMEDKRIAILDGEPEMEFSDMIDSWVEAAKKEKKAKKNKRIPILDGVPEMSPKEMIQSWMEVDIDEKEWQEENKESKEK